SVVTSVSHATRLSGSCDRQKSSTASLIWSATLSGWPIDTDSLVNRYRSALTTRVLVLGYGVGPMASGPRDYRSSGWIVATARIYHARAAAAHQRRRPDAAPAALRPAPARPGRGRLGAPAARGAA